MTLQEIVDKYGSMFLTRIENPKMDTSGHLVTRKRIEQLDGRDIVIESALTEVHYRLTVGDAIILIGDSAEDALSKVI